ncbi:MAG: PAS domain-containing sensor histidine kinase [Curvibacter sp.]|nr:PAS domain-containing sensor histidine kinase [Curvibacter sp.]
MAAADAPPSWFGPMPGEAGSAPAAQDRTTGRVWHGFLTARLMVATALLLLQLLSHLLSQAATPWVLALDAAYLAVTLAARLLATERPPSPAIGRQWVPTLGLDLLVFSVLQWTQPGNMNYTPLLAMPVLMAATLGSRRLTLFTAASSTLVLLAQAWSLHLHGVGDQAPLFMQAGLTGTAYFLLGLLVNHLAQRLAREEMLSQSSRMAARVQAQVNAMVIDSLTEGLLVLDANESVRALNPAARQLLGPTALDSADSFQLGEVPAWRPLRQLVRETFRQGSGQSADVHLPMGELGTARLHLRTQLTASSDPLAGNLCVMFLHDLREMEARLRTEKLAAMGRMSAAVAHEIRNPLAAITQANGLLEEDVQDPGQRRLILMVQQNAQRLARIVEDVLDIARVEHQRPPDPDEALELDPAVADTCREWLAQDRGRRLQADLDSGDVHVAFDADHLRRVLVNLLDNAQRYMGPHGDSLQVSTRVGSQGLASVQVWSDGQPMEPSVQRHLFEPFFSSESRSSGLGLYICRQLCERHGASIDYQRCSAPTARGLQEGNAFVVRFAVRPMPRGQRQQAFDTMTG